MLPSVENDYQNWKEKLEKACNQLSRTDRVPGGDSYILQHRREHRYEIP